jgi:hypothetical protein
MNISKGVKVTRCINYTAAGTSSPVSGSIIDMKGYDSVTFIVGFGTIVSGAATSIKVQQDTDSAMGSAADLTGTSVTVGDGDDSKVAIVEVNQPRERYVRVQVLRATQNSTIDFGLALQSKANSEPVTHDSSTVLGSEFHQAPAEGTA